MINDEHLENYILEHIDEEGRHLKKVNRDTYVKLLRPRMCSGHLQGRILNMICQLVRPRYILELGTFSGYSALCMAESLADDPLAELHTIDIDDELEEFASSNFENSEYGDKIHLHIGDAIEIIPTIDRIFDVVFIDANKRIYSEYYDLVFDKVRKGGLIIADNTLWDGKVIQDPLPKDAQSVGILNFNDKIKNDDRVEKVILPLRDGMTLIRKK
ncbi:MAG: O-methyltransferase [Bacteroidales bacterium]|nr:O-methyltransferase [Bacteroidales bacterium]